MISWRWSEGMRASSSATAESKADRLTVWKAFLCRRTDSVAR
jgi:hypothetical protein